MGQLDKAIFCAWKSGDEAAKQKAWLWLWQVLLSEVERFCCQLCHDTAMAQDCAVEAFNRTMKEIEDKIRQGDVGWQGEESFVAYVRKRLRYRCRDECRRRWREQKRTVSLDAPTDSGVPLLDLLDLWGFTEKSPEQILFNANGARSTVRLLAALREACRRRKALVEVLHLVEEYLRDALARAVPSEMIKPNMSFDDLLEAVAMEQLRVIRTEMNKFIMRKLDITENTVNLRMREIRRVLDELR
jgi:DNA-directed RNA polymerase specialized sigma24 family protein